jgi:hypothetical protein
MPFECQLKRRQADAKALGFSQKNQRKSGVATLASLAALAGLPLVFLLRNLMLWLYFMFQMKKTFFFTDGTFLYGGRIPTYLIPTHNPYKHIHFPREYAEAMTGYICMMQENISESHIYKLHFYSLHLINQKTNYFQYKR